MKKYKAPKKGAVARLRELYKEKRKQKRFPEVLEKIKEMFRCKEQVRDLMICAFTYNHLKQLQFSKSHDVYLLNIQSIHNRLCCV